MHICFGYAAIIHERLEATRSCPELAGCTCDQVSIETAQSGLDLGVLADLSGKTIILGVLDLSDPAVEPPDVVAGRARRAFEFLPPEQVVLAPDCGMKYLPRPSAYGKLRSMVAAAGELRREGRRGLTALRSTAPPHPGSRGGGPEARPCRGLCRSRSSCSFACR